jgi:hypothetical protein
MKYSKLTGSDMDWDLVCLSSEAKQRKACELSQTDRADEPMVYRLECDGGGG